MVGLVTFAGTVLVLALLGNAVPRWLPWPLARLAVVPVGASLRVALPTHAQAVLFAPEDEATTYRQRRLVRRPGTALPGNDRVECGEAVMRFAPDGSAVLARSRPNHALTRVPGVLRVDVTVTEDHIDLRAYFFPYVALSFALLLMMGLSKVWTSFEGLAWLVALVVGMFFGERNSARTVFSAVALEVKQRVAVLDASDSS